MRRWIAFDNHTAEILRRGLSEDARISLTTGSPVGMAIAEAPSVLVMPGDSAVKAVLAYIEKRAPKIERDDSMSYQATGFLGLVDEPVYDDEPKPQKKSWWKKLID